VIGDDGEQRILIKGLVIPVDWDQTGGVRRIGVLTDDEGEYEVEAGGACDQLLTHLRSEILAEAVLLDPIDPVRRVRVESFAVLDWKDSDDWSPARGT